MREGLRMTGLRAGGILCDEMGELRRTTTHVASCENFIYTWDAMAQSARCDGSKRDIAFGEEEASRVGAISHLPPRALTRATTYLFPCYSADY